MTKAFKQDLASSSRIEPEAWARRPLMQKLRQHFFRLFERFW
jgi:hypothetical protein